MLKKILTLAAAPVVALGISWGAAAAATAAPMPATVTTTTNFSYMVGSPVLTTAPHNFTPPNGTAVQLDLTQAIHAAGVSDLTEAQGDAVADVNTLVTSGVIALSNVSHVPGSDVFLNLFAVDSNFHTGTFEMSATNGGLGITIPPFTIHGTVSNAGAKGTAAVTWERLPVVIAPSPTPTGHGNVPFVFAGHVITVSAHNAVVGWSEGGTWPSDNHCVRVYIYGFDRPLGTAHVGFTCDNGNRAADIGVLSGLADGHSVALFVQPATGTYGDNQPIPGTNPMAHIEVVTPAA